MKILVASRNPAKLAGTRRAAAEAIPVPHRVESVPFPHSFPGMPRGEEVVRGARGRAQWALKQGADLGVGIESGLFPLPGLTAEFLVTVACVVGEGREGWGASAGFPFAFRSASPEPTRGYVYRLTRGRMAREELVFQAVLLALFSWLGEAG